VITSASSKVALAMTLFVKNDKEHLADTKIIGYTSESNKNFCRSTGLYDDILGYNEPLGSKGDDVEAPTKKKYVMIEISGRGDVYKMNQQNNNSNKIDIVKLLATGNAADVNDKQFTFSHFSWYATIKLMLSLMGAPRWIRSWMNPVQDLYNIMDDMIELKQKWGVEKFKETQKEYGKMFYQAAKEWISIRQCDNEATIEKAFSDIMEGTVPPSETIVLDASEAVAHRK
jgi:hypothetical protein